MNGFIQELKRRNVLKVAVAYIVTGWLIVQVLDAVVPMLLLPDWVSRAILLMLIVGFPIALILAWAFELTPEGIKRDRDIAPGERASHDSGRRIDFVIIALLVIAVGYLTVDKFLLRDVTESEVAEGEASIAVLPFTDMSAEQDQEYFADGISEELLNVLAKVPDFHVAGRTSSFAFKGENQDLRKIGDMLGVEHILEGSVRKAGDTVRITAQLVKADNGFHLWSDTYDRTLDDIFAVQDEIAQAVVAELKATLLGDEPAPVRMTGTVTGDTEAYDLYLRARFQMHKRTPESLARSIDYYQQVIAMDPDYAPAWAGLAVAWMLSNQYSDVDRQQSMRQAEEAINRAMALDDEDADTWAALGLLYLQQGDSAESQRALHRAIELNPNHTMAHMWMGNAVAGTDFAGQTEYYKRAYAIDPLHLTVLDNYADAAMNEGDGKAAREAAQLMREAHPRSGYGEAVLGALAKQEGRLDEAVLWFYRAYQTAPERIAGFQQLPFVLIDLHEMELADAWLSRGETLAPNAILILWGRFRWYLHEKDLVNLEAYMQDGLERYPWFPPIVASAGLARLLNGDLEGSLELIEGVMRVPAAEGKGELAIGGRRVFFAPWYAAALAAAGRSGEAVQVAETARTIVEEQMDQGLLFNSIYSQHLILAQLHALLGDRERAMLELRQAVANGVRDPWRWRIDPALAAVHDDVGFAALAQEVEVQVADQRARLADAGLLLTPDQVLAAELEGAEDRL